MQQKAAQPRGKAPPKMNSLNLSESYLWLHWLSSREQPRADLQAGEILETWKPLGWSESILPQWLMETTAGWFNILGIDVMTLIDWRNDVMIHAEKNSRPPTA